MVVSESRGLLRVCTCVRDFVTCECTCVFAFESTINECLRVRDPVNECVSVCVIISSIVCVNLYE